MSSGLIYGQSKTKDKINFIVVCVKQLVII